jgi:hypothetical protein
MASWATRRKFTYLGIGAVVVIVIIGVPAFKILYKAPTCADGVQNQGEQGIDCGGPCRTLCQSAFLAPVVLWTAATHVTAGLYNLAAYIENPNISGAAINAPYQFSVYDTDGVLITQVSGTLDIPANRNTLAFAGAVDMGQRTVAKGGVSFQFTQAPVWRKSEDMLAALSYPTPQYSEDNTSATKSSSLQVAMTNTSLTPFNGITVYAILKDINNNEIDFSKTYIDEIAPGASEVAPFTWPVSHNGTVVSEEILPVITPVLDN